LEAFRPSTTSGYYGEGEHTNRVGDGSEGDVAVDVTGAARDSARDVEVADDERVDEASASWRDGVRGASESLFIVSDL